MIAGITSLLLRYALLAVAVVLLNFMIPRLLPGDPLDFGAADGTGPAVPLSGAAKASLQRYYHLDDPWSDQLTAYLGNLAHGDLGQSIARPAPVRDLVLDRLPWTLGLLLCASLLSTVVGTAAGIAAGWLPGGTRDRLLTSGASALAAVPEFLVAIGLLLIFAVGFRWFPLYGGQTVFPNYGDDLANWPRRALDIAWHLTLPAATLALTGASAFVLISRDTTAALRHEPWLTTARAKGLPERRIARRHALPNMALPLLTFFGLRLGAVLGGALVVERVFNVPGLGQLAFNAIRARDYPVLQALFLLASLGVLAANLAVELIYLRFIATHDRSHA